jgi:acetyl-CoA synthetase
MTVQSGNITDWAVDCHVREGRGDQLAMRFIAKDGTRRDYRYVDLAGESMRIAAVLADLGVEPSERVFILAGRIPATYLTILGALRRRAVVCPLFSAFGPEPIKQRLQLGGAVVLATTAALYRRKVAPIIDEVPSLRHVLIIDDGEAPERTSSLGELLAEVDSSIGAETDPVIELGVGATHPEDPALLHFTSGTTGTPKGALHVHGAVRSHLDSAREVFGLEPSEVYWCTADPGWVTGTSYGIVAPLACGAQMIIDEAEFEAERWYRILQDERVAVWYTAPTAIRMLMKSGDELPSRFDLSALRRALSVGEPLDAEAVIWGGEVLGRQICDTWWQTETGSIMIASTPEIGIQPGSMGKPVPWITAGLLRCDDEGELIFDDQGAVIEITQPDEVGVLALRTPWPSMFRAYLGDEERYRACFVGGWYVAGDLARRDSGGYYWFIGRADDVIKTAGHLIGPFEVEQVLMEHPDVVQAGVYGVPDEMAGAVIHARIVLRPGVEESQALMTEVLANARRRLGPAVAPREINVIETLPITRSGKVMRRLLRARELGLPEGDLSTLETDPISPEADDD